MCYSQGQTQPVIKSDSLTHMFGYACGIGGSPMPFMLTTIKLVNSYDSIEIRKLAYSDNPQERIHGILALYFLKRNGSILTKSDKEIFEVSKKSDVSVNVCEGCAFGRKRTFRYLLSNKNLKAYYDWYDKSGWKNFR